MPYVEKFTAILLSVILVALISNSTQLISAEQNIPIEGLFSGPAQVELVTTEDSNYLIYLQVIVRSADGQLISVIESTAHGSLIPHMISDHVFDTLMSEKEIITVDDI